MELRHLKYFLKVAEEKNFSKAAEKLFISQPPLSRQIKELENELQARLFDRNNKRVVLTDAGRFFESEITQVMQNLERIKLKTQKIATNVSGEFRIAYISSTFSGVISDLIKYLSQEYPYASFKLNEIRTAQQIEDLEQGKLDLGILRAPLQSANVDTELWYNDGYALVYNKDLFQLKSEKELKNFKDETFVFFNKDFAPHYHNSLMEICAGYGFTPNVVHESNNINSIIQLVKNGLGFSIVPTSVVKNHNDKELAFKVLKDIKLYTEVLLATPKGERSEITQAALRFLKQAI